MGGKGRSSARSGEDASSRLAVEQVAISSLKPDPGNARPRSVKQIRQIAMSIAACGFKAPSSNRRLSRRRPAARLGRADRPGAEAAPEPGERRLLHGNVEAMRSGIELARIGVGRIGPSVGRRKS
jgi:hypothetical protein